MSEWTEERLAALGYRQYEISNWARAGGPAGRAGPAGTTSSTGGRASTWAWGRARTASSTACATPSSAARRATSRRCGRGAEEARWAAVVSQETVDPATAAVDAAVLGLRLNAGIDEAALRSRYGDAWAVVEPGLRWGEQLGPAGAVGGLGCV